MKCITYHYINQNYEMPGNDIFLSILIISDHEQFHQKWEDIWEDIPGSWIRRLSFKEIYSLLIN